MIKAALTGGIATGKSFVVADLLAQGVPCLDADELAHGVMQPGTEATAAIAERFGAEVIDASGAVDREVLGPIVFRDSAARRDLEAIVHPAVYRAISAGLRAFERLGDTPLAIADIPLLYETGRAADFDAVIATVCSVEHQMERLRARGLTDDQARQRLAAQLPAEEKARRADYVITTDGTFDETRQQLAKVLESLRGRSAST
jgi:dephospho-CoA kinase